MRIQPGGGTRASRDALHASCTHLFAQSLCSRCGPLLLEHGESLALLGLATIPCEHVGSLMRAAQLLPGTCRALPVVCDLQGIRFREDRKSTRLNSSHLGISYAV